MSRSVRAQPPPVKAPTDRGSTILIGLGVAVSCMTFLAPSLVAVGIGGGALFVGLGVRQRVLGRAVVRTHAALQAITRGQTEEAEAHLDAIPRWVRNSGTIMRSALHQRALIAFYRSDPATAVAVIAPATTTRVKLATKNYEHMQRSTALSLRALAYASMGDSERALADVRDVLSSEHATPESLARSRLAEAVLHARSGAMDALAAHFRAHGSLVLEHTFPRERVLARALRKMVQARARTVYREAARPDEEERPTGAIGEWIASIAPDAAVHATDAARLATRSEAAAPATVSAETTETANTARVEPTTAKRRKGPPVLVVFGVLAVALYYVVSFLLPGDASGDAGSSLGLDSMLVAFFALVTAIFGIGIAKVVWAGRRAREDERTMLAAQRALALGVPKTADPLLAALERSRRGIAGAQAYFMRAKYAEQQARFGECIDLCNLALGSVAAQDQAHRMLASIALTPSIVALRGLALAAMGRSAEASGDLATIARDHGTWSHRASSELRMRLMLAVKSGDLDAARVIARERTPELPITLRDETLADLVLATAPHGASREEQERVDTEIREDPTLRTWMDAVAPDLCADLARRVSGKNVRIDVGEETRADELDEDAADEAAADAAFRRA